jgi:hypothetical protein
MNQEAALQQGNAAFKSSSQCFQIVTFLDRDPSVNAYYLTCLKDYSLQ